MGMAVEIAGNERLEPTYLGAHRVVSWLLLNCKSEGSTMTNTPRSSADDNNGGAEEPPETPPAALDPADIPVANETPEEEASSPISRQPDVTGTDAIARLGDLGARLSSTWARTLVDAQFQEILAKLDKLTFPTLSDSDLFKQVSEAPTAYSTKMTSQASYFDTVAIEINSFEKLQSEVAKLLAKNPELTFVWRGAREAKWGLHSSLFRKLAIHNGVVFPGDGGAPKDKQSFPTEEQLVGTESAMIEAARTLWRMDDLSPLEILARFQHFGAPTRLIDVTLNPYIAAWFAAERNPETDGEHGRLFAIATAPVPKSGEDSSPATVRISDLPNLPVPFWHLYETKEDRQKADWGTGSRRTLWVPPAYDARIVAQNAAFILDGVPMTSQEIAPYFRFAHNDYLSRADNLASSSIYARAEPTSRAARAIKPNLAPTFSWRITPEGKRNIQETLERHFGYTFATIYPDNAGLGAYLDAHLDQFAPPV